MKVKLRDLLKPTISLFLICLVVTGALAVTYVGTKDTIAQRTAQDAEQARLEVFAGADSFRKVEDLDSVVSSKPELKIVKEAYEGMKNGTAGGYVFSVESKGYGGIIKLTVGVDFNGTVTGVKIGDNSETPGLGQKAKDQPFIGQFAGLQPKETLKVVKGNKSKPEEIDAISGATITSRAVTKAVQAAVDTAAALKSKEGGSN